MREAGAEKERVKKWKEVAGGAKGNADKGNVRRVVSLLKMFTGLLRVKWVASAVTSMQTTSKHNSLIHRAVDPSVSSRLSRSSLLDQIK